MSKDTHLPWEKRPLTARDFALTVLAGVALLAVAIGLLLSVLRPVPQAQTASQPVAAPTAQPVSGGGDLAEQGSALFQAHCVACHTIGGGRLVGPDLEGVSERRDLAWLQRWILEPDRVLAEGDPLAQQLLAEFNNIPMPNLGLSPAEVEALIAYLSGSAAVAAQPEPSLPPGDAAAGRLLFLGEARPENGGPSCMACHSVAGIGALGGGALGPDLSQAVAKYGGPQGLDAFLGGVPTPTMNAVWADRPLGEQERANLIAFLEAAALQQRAPEALQQVAGLAAGGAVVFIGIAGLVWRRRLGQVRRPMLRRSA